MSSPILEIKSQRSRSPGRKTCLALPRPTQLALEWYAWYALAASAMQLQHAAAADELISWWPKGDCMQRCLLRIQYCAWASELGAAASTKAIWWDLQYCKPAEALVFFVCVLLVTN